MKDIKFTHIAMGNTSGVDDLYALDTEGQLWLLDDGQTWSKVDHPVEDLPSPEQTTKSMDAYKAREARRKDTSWPRESK